MANLNLNLPSATGSESPVKFKSDLIGDMQSLESSNNAIESRQLNVDGIIATINSASATTAADVTTAQQERIAAEQAAAAADANRITAQAAWTAALAANPDLNPALRMNPSTLDTSMTIPTGFNGYSAGLLTIGEGANITIGDNANWNII